MRISWPAVVAVGFMLLALVSVLYMDFDRAIQTAYVFGLCSIASALLALRDR